MLNLTRNVLPDNVNCIYIRQSEALGLGHAVLCAKSVIVNEPFAVILADELLDAKPSGLKQMIEVYEKTSSSVLGLYEVDPSEVSSYGIVKLSNECSQSQKITQIIEKPKPEKAPSNLAVIGRYILTPRILTELANTKKGIGNEIQLTDAIASLLQHEPIYGHIINGVRYDCGSKIGYLKATVNFGLKHPETSKEFEEFLQSYHHN